MIDTNELTIAQLLETCQKSTRVANQAEERIRAWGVLMKGIRLLIESYIDNDAIPSWLDKLQTYANQLQSNRVIMLDEIAKNARADAARCLEVYEIRGMN